MSERPEIRLLDPETIDKIAAGEVVERPASVAKELIENAIDAGAKNITVEWKDGGISYLRVTDDGGGIPGDELRAAFLRHSTSKLRTIKDLDSISSLGFRGEALSSIAAVSKTEVFTKTADDVMGSHYCIEGSEEVSLEETAAPNGTSIFVRQLFYNTPVRRKFLKSPMTEGNYMAELTSRIALSHPEISFSLIADGREKLFTPGNGKLFDCIYREDGREVASHLYDVSYSDETLSVRGFLGQPEIRRSNRNREIFFVNGRYIKSKLLSKAVEDAYQGFLMLHQYPYCVLFLSFPDGHVDVNVHPRKAEVRFTDEPAVYDSVYKAVRLRLSAAVDIPKADFSTVDEKVVSTDEKAPEVFEQSRLKSYKEAVQQEISSALPIEKAPDSSLSTDSEDRSLFKGNGSIENSFLPSEAASEGDLSHAADESMTPSYDTVTFSHQQNRAAAEAAGAAPAVFMRTASTEKQEQLSFLSAEAVKSHRIIGQIFETYWIVEYDGKVYIIDQHAAHEKVMYERFMKQYAEKQMTSQQIAPPLVVSLSPLEEDTYRTYSEAFSELGFEVEAFGGSEYRITAVPGNLYSLDPEQIFLETLSDLSDGKGRAINDTLYIRVATMACKAAVKGNTHLPEPEARALIEELLTLDNPYHCPHGRPTMISISETDLEKRFKRIV
ncbi:MAG: DNA mismatch repair endonuclease MutL [Lachnospiraceae bacterium]|nr:DNA mismatch repair endonuclease MutL [Lachnospiraceae bacterium]